MKKSIVLLLIVLGAISFNASAQVQMQVQLQYSNGYPQSNCYSNGYATNNGYNNQGYVYAGIYYVYVDALGCWHIRPCDSRITDNCESYVANNGCCYYRTGYNQWQCYNRANSYDRNFYYNQEYGALNSGPYSRFQSADQGTIGGYNRNNRNGNGQLGQQYQYRSRNYSNRGRGGLNRY